ncbi:MAG TPA: O-antigen ligase family protein [Solirubrobacteraceae bacterium]
MCAAPALGLLLWWSGRNGGYDGPSWLGGAIGLVVLAVWARLVFGPGRALGSRGRLALTALGLYVGWSFASVLWAVDKGTALTGSDRALLYLVLFALFASLDWTTRRLELTLVAYLLGIGALSALVLAELALGPAPRLLQSGQLAAGLGYHNATAALGTIGALGSVLVGSSDRARPLTRAGLAAVAAACLEVSLLAQSRGWLYTLPLILAVVIAFSPERGRAVMWSVIPIGCVLATLPWVLHSWAHPTAVTDVGSARAGLLAVLASGAVGLLVAHLQWRYELSPRGWRGIRAAGRTAAALAVAAVTGVAALAISGGAVARGWHQFTTDTPVHPGVQRFAELGSGRYDFWRVALRGFLDHPLGGLGQDNFAQAYLVSRHTGEEPTWLHSLELRLLAHTGAVGFLLFAGFLVFALGAYRLASRGADPRRRLVLAAALVPLAVWVVHGSFDWFWEIPALSGVVFAFLGAVVALESRRERKASSRVSVALIAVVGALALLGPAYLGERSLAAGRALAAARPATALGDLSLAARLEPLSSVPQTLAAGIELRAGDGAAALRLAEAGLRRNAGDWVSWLVDGLAAGRAGQPERARADLKRARALDPREPVIALAGRRAGTRAPLTIAEAESVLSARAQARVKP